jgi:hypothetical protein
MQTLSRCCAMLFFLGALPIWAQSKTVELRPAKIGSFYQHKLETNRSAVFKKCGGADWLEVSPDGLLAGTPPDDAPVWNAVIVYATPLDYRGNPERGHKPVSRTFVVPVQPDDCAAHDDADLAWCHEGKLDPDVPIPVADECAAGPEQRPSKKARIAFQPNEINSPRPNKNGTSLDPGKDCDGQGCIVQFDRLHEGAHEFGHFQPGMQKVDWGNVSFKGLPKEAIIRAINGSKVFLSGSVLIRTNVEHCGFWAWSVVAEAQESSNNLFYGPSDLASFCTDEPNGTALIVLPVHAIWASAYGIPANTNDPTWKPNGPPPPGHACFTGAKTDASPQWGIRLCDIVTHPYTSDDNDEKPNWLLRRVLYSHFFEGIYNRGEEPGVSQGSISIAPIAPKTKSTMDVQLYESFRHGPGWLGLQGVYEHDRSPSDDLNSLTAALTYDLRFTPGRRFWIPSRIRYCHGDNDDCSPPWAGVRPMELLLRTGTEWSPASFNFKPSTQVKNHNVTTTTYLATEYLGRNVNFVTSEAFRLPIVLNPIRSSYVKQPSQFTVAPIVGLEQGFRVVSHPICSGVTQQVCNPQPQKIARQFAGFDASARSPYNWTRNFLGDRPLTVDYSFRMRRLSYQEPFANQQYVAYDNITKLASGQSAGERTYTRITAIAPISAYLQIRATWQHGALPPLFQYVGDQVTFGLTFSNPGSSEH